MKEIRVATISSLAHLRPQYNDGVEGSPEMMALLISRRIHIETKWGNAGELEKVAEKEDVDAAEFDVVLDGFHGAESVVKRDHELAIHHADFVDNEVSTIGSF